MIFDRDTLQKAADMAKLSKHAYTGKSGDMPEGWSVADTSAGVESGGFHAVLYRNDKAQAGEPRYAVAFRGTKDMADVVDDISIAFGELPAQFPQAVAFVQEMCRIHGIQAEDMALTGHSLGGYLARTAGTVLAVDKIWLFNSPGPTQQTREDLDKLIPGTHLPSDKIIHIRSQNDVVSHWGYDEGNILEVQTRGRHHGLSGLQKQIDALRGVSSVPDAAHEKKNCTLRKIFNKVSKMLARSRLMKHAVKLMFNNASRDNRGKGGYAPGMGVPRAARKVPPVAYGLG